MEQTRIHLQESEQQLIKKCAKGEEPAQAMLYKMYSPLMLSVCLRYSKNRDEAQDILHDGFIKVFLNIHKFRNDGSLEGWIRRIMVNTALTKYKAKTKMQIIPPVEDIPFEIEDKNQDIIEYIGQKELLEMVQALSPGYRIIFNLYVFEGYKHREIADMLGITEGTSKSNLFDARLILQSAISKKYGVAYLNKSV